MSMSKYKGLRCPHCCGKLPGYISRDAELARIREATIRDAEVFALQNQINTAAAYLADEGRARGERIRLAELALEDKREP